MWRHLIGDLLQRYVPIMAAWIAAVLLSDSSQSKKKKMAFWGASTLLVIVLAASLLTLPPDPPLEVELAFYAVRGNPHASQNLWSLMGSEESGDKQTRLLGIERTAPMAGIPEIKSGDNAQLRIKLNRKGYVQIVHVDSTLQKIRQLFPSATNLHSQEVPADMWVEIPPGVEGWRFDAVPGYEMFVVLVSTRPADDISLEIARLCENITQESQNPGDFLISLENALRQVSVCGETSCGTYSHGLVNVEPSTVQTRVFRSVDGESAILVRRIRHIS